MNSRVPAPGPHFYLRTCVLALLFSITAVLPAQEREVGFGITCSTQGTDTLSFMSAPASVLNGSAQQFSTFIFDFGDEVPVEARDAMIFAGEVWGSYLESEVPIRVSVDWAERDNPNTLASAGPATLFRDFPGVLPDTWYPVALAEAVAGRPLNDDDEPDINIIANSEASWYFPTDGNVPRNRIDLTSVILHELGHGLGFLSSVDSVSPTTVQVGFSGRTIVYDEFIETPLEERIVDPGIFASPSEELLDAVINSLVFGGPEAQSRNGGRPVPLFAPETFDIGSSVSHLDERAYPPGNENSLMTPFIRAGEAIHDPGPVTLGIFADLGWPIRFELVSVREPVFEHITVFPNPVRNSFVVSLADLDDPREALLYGPDGRVALRADVRGARGKVRIGVGGLAPGVYTLWVAGRERGVRSRVMVW